MKGRCEVPTDNSESRDLKRFVRVSTRGRVIEDEEGEIPSTCTYISQGKNYMTYLDVYV